MSYQPPFSITPVILQSVADMCELLGKWSVSADAALSPHLRRNNRIRTIQASLAIENNTLSLEQVTAVIEGRRVLGLPREFRKCETLLRPMSAFPAGRQARPTICWPRMAC